MMMKVLCMFLSLMSSSSFGPSTALGLATPSTTTPSRFIGFDLGTSGARISVIEKKQDDDEEDGLQEVHTQAVAWGDPSQQDSSSSLSYDDPASWMNAIETLLLDANNNLKDDGGLSTVQSICCSGTSASCLIVDSKANKVTRKPRMYNYDVIASRNDDEDPTCALRAMELLDKWAPPKHTARAQSGSLAKLLTWNEENQLSSSERLCHQADYIAMLLQSNDRACGAGPANTWAVSSDWHNCLKLGYDVQNDEWPSWMTDCLKEANKSNNPLQVLPQKVVSPGAPLGTISDDVAERFGLPKDTVVVGGTTDSNAAFFAAASGQPIVPGTAVTSLGSTLAIKYASQEYVEDADRGVYSHRFPSVFFSDNNDDNNNKSYWLAGGASNVGCAILRQEEFSTEELVELSNQIDPNTDSALEYYPLVKRGERFPIADSNKEPILTPKPDNRQEYLHGILQGISNVERDGFQILGELGASPSKPKIIYTCGGGSRNDMWSQLRERRFNEAFANGAAEHQQEEPLKVLRAENTEAGFGAAILAAATFIEK